MNLYAQVLAAAAARRLARVQLRTYRRMQRLRLTVINGGKK